MSFLLDCPHCGSRPVTEFAFGSEIAAREWATEDDLLARFFTAHPRIIRYAVRLKKDGTLPTLEPYTDPRHFSEFLTLLTAQQILARRKGAWIGIAA